MRALLLLWKIGTVGAVDRGEQRVLSLGGMPSLANRGGRDRHCIGRLMASDAGAAVRAQWFKEGMALGAHRAGDVYNAQLSKRVGESKFPGKYAALARLDPASLLLTRIRSGPKRRRERYRQQHANTGHDLLPHLLGVRFPVASLQGN